VSLKILHFEMSGGGGGALTPPWGVFSKNKKLIDLLF
jgi:hypothetical protein